MSMLRANSLKARTWSEVAAEQVATAGRSRGAAANHGGVLVAVKTVEGSGINMQHHADAIVCRPTPGDLLEQMKGRVDRPGQSAKELKLIVLMAEHTLEEARFANIRQAGNFFREYIAPVARTYRERIDLEAMLAAAGTGKLKKNTVYDAWHASLARRARRARSRASAARARTVRRMTA